MLTFLLQRAEWLSFALNIFLMAVFLWQRDFAKACYWGGAMLVVIGVIWMRSH